MISASLITALVALLAFLLSKRSSGQGPRNAAPGESLHLLSRQGLGPKAGVALMRAGDALFLVGYGEQPPALLARIVSPSLAAPAQRIQPSGASPIRHAGLRARHKRRDTCVAVSTPRSPLEAP